MNGTVLPPVTEDTFCKYVLYYEINNSRVRIWDLIILIPNALFVLFLVVRFNKAQLKLRATSSPIFLTFYTLVWGNVIISLVRCAVSMTVNAAMPLGGLVDKVLWVMVRFFLLATEMSVVIFGLAFGHLDSRSSIRYVLLATSLLSLAFTVTQGTLEIVMPDDMFHVDTRDYDLFGHGGMLFWFTSSLVFALIYFLILLLPWIPLREYLALPTKLSFYLYVLLLALLDTTQAVGAGLLAWGNMQSGLCVVDVTTWLYFSLYTPLVYHTFLSEFFSVSQPSIMFSYKAQMDEPMDEDQVSLPHQQSFSSLKTDSDYIYQQSNSVYDSTLFEAGGTTPMNPVYSASLQSPDSIASVKNLYSPAALGIDGFLLTRKRAKEQFTSYSDKFRAKMNEFAASQGNMIFTEDLKNMVHLAEPTDLKLILSMIQKFNSQNTELRFGSYVFGPVVMRMFHFLDAPKEALECFYDPKNDGFFDQHVSYHILLDLLYSHEMYDEMYKIFDRVQQKQINMSKFPKYSVVMVLAACYKQNTPKSLEYASKLWSDMASAGSVPVRRACTFFAALALKQGAPHIALESISSQKQHYVTIRNIKAMALADMGRVEDTLPILRTVLDIESPMQKDKHTFFEETVIRVRQAVEKSKNKDVQKKFEDVEKALKDRRLIDSNNSLDQLLNSEIQKQKPLDQSQQSRGPFQFKRPQLGPRQKKRIV